MQQKPPEGSKVDSGTRTQQSHSKKNPYQREETLKCCHTKRQEGEDGEGVEPRS